MILGIANIKKGMPYDIYIGRANSFLGLEQSKWHNPFKLEREGDRERIIKQYKEYILERTDLLECLEELEGKILGCYCYPKLCHGNVLSELLMLKKLGML